MAKRSRAHYTDKIRDHILDALKAFDPATQVGLPWRQDSLPFNASTGKCYSGLNVFLLAVTLHRLGADASQGFLTSNQGRQFGGMVKKGEKGTCCLFYRRVKKRNEDTGEEESYAMARYFHVFHVSQFEGLDEQALLSPVREPVAFSHEEISVAPDTLDTLTRLVCEVDVPTSVGGGRAFYTPLRPRSCREIHDGRRATGRAAWPGRW